MEIRVESKEKMRDEDITFSNGEKDEWGYRRKEKRDGCPY